MRSGILGFTVLLVLLAGCSAAPALPTAEPGASATATPRAVPGSRIVPGCDDLVPPDVRASVSGLSAPLIVAADLNLSEITAPETAGVRMCRWGAESGAEILRLTVTADRADIDRFTANRPQGFIDEPQAIDTVADRSIIGCESAGSPAGTACHFSVLSGPYWFGGFLSSDDPDVDRVLGLVTTMFGGIAERLTAATLLPPWIPPQTSTAAPYDCSWMDAGGAVAAAMGEDVGLGAVGPSGPPLDPMSGIYEARVGAVWCALETYSLSLEYVAGSAWNWESASSGWDVIDVAGAEQAVSRCADDCRVRAVVEDTIVEARGFGDGGEVALRARVVAGLEAGIPLLPLVP